VKPLLLHPLWLDAMRLDEVDENSHIQLAELDHFGQDEALRRRHGQVIRTGRSGGVGDVPITYLFIVTKDGFHGWDRLPNAAGAKKKTKK
jgi:hypothetical protein